MVDMIILTNIVCVLFGSAIPTSSFIILKQGKFVISTVLPLVCILNAKQPRLCGILLIFYFKYPLNYNIIDIASTLIILMLTIRMRV